VPAGGGEHARQLPDRQGALLGVIAAEVDLVGAHVGAHPVGRVGAGVGAVVDRV
jgi:hypothetical protein